LLLLAAQTATNVKAAMIRKGALKPSNITISIISNDDNGIDICCYNDHNFGAVIYYTFFGENQHRYIKVNAYSKVQLFSGNLNSKCFIEKKCKSDQTTIISNC